MNDCESCIHYPPSVMGKKPCGICYPETPGMSFYQKKEKPQKPMFEEKIIWHEIETRRLTAEEEAEYIERGYAAYEVPQYAFSCEMPKDRQEILIATIWGVSQDMCMVESDEYGNNLFELEEHGDWDGVKAWAAMPKYKGGEENG